MRKLIINAGLHKTATTTIQRACFDNIKKLKDFNLNYPVFQTRAGLELNQSPIIHAMFSHDNKDILCAFDQLINSTSQDLLIVAEGVSNLTVDGLINLKSYFESRDFFIEVHIYIRPISSWINSFTSQRVWGPSGPRNTISHTLNEFLEGGIIKYRVEAIDDLFDNFKVHKFTDAISHPQGPAGHFFNEINVSLPMNTSGSYNIGGSDCMVRLLNEINQLVGNREHSKESQLFHGRLYSKFPKLQTSLGEKFHLRTSEVTPLLPMIINENKWLKDRFGEEFYEDEFKFSNEPFMLSDEQRKFMIDNFKESAQPMRGIVEEFVTKY